MTDRRALAGAFFLSLVLVGFAPAADAEPPPPPGAADLVGVWSYRWGATWEGRVTFYADGTYWQYDRLGDRRSVGTWRLEGGVLRLSDRPLLAWRNMEPAEWTQDCAAALSDRAQGYLGGASLTGDAVSFFDREEFPRP